MTHPGLLDNKTRTIQTPYYILIIEDNTRLRSMLARYIMMNCDTFHHTCAIYHLDLQGVPRLTYSHRPDLPEGDNEDFIILEADSPQRALSWLRRAHLKKLTIISDVMMPADTDVGLPGLLTALEYLQLAVNLIFVSSESQNREYVQALLGAQQLFFLVKGSEAWRRLPTALVEHASQFQYRLLAKAAPPPERPVLKEKPDEPIQVRPAQVSPPAYQSVSSQTVEDSHVAAPTRPKLWQRMKDWFAAQFR